MYRKNRERSVCPLGGQKPEETKIKMERVPRRPAP
uniref:Uncharacterized protein n=1 Tax=Arundo donax TaxID=35708 RepID=A0A0A9A352_ARUDO